MKIAHSILAMVARQELSRKKVAWLIVLLVNFVSGCAALHNSVSFYQNQPRRPINWREYTSD
jgi:hypothetical protein